MTERPSHAREPVALLAATWLVLLWSGVRPLERGTWWLEIAPIVIGTPMLIASFQRFRLSPLLYRLLFLHAVILAVGGHYTYAKVPLGFWAEDWLGFSRNHYDRIGHLAQGFVPAILAREILLRRSPLRRGKWLFLTVVCICLAFSAFYEMIEWWVAVLGGSSAESFLGTQGDVWDTQWDMFLALVGSMASLLLMGRLHDRSMRSLDPARDGTAKTHTGECLCGAIRFEVRRFAGPFELCHCSRCRKAFGSAFAAMIGVERRDFSWLDGEERVRRFEAPVRRAPPGFRTAFCSTCGSPAPNIPDGAEWFEIPVGLLDESFDKLPDRHIYVDHASRWHEIRDDLPRLTERERYELLRTQRQKP